ncbi:hypothetical protein [uncultured Shewanella sp.]|uniref:hypothetical protein n=1 Tax=uncultured Shewanella sp. TaxID=173975 RepID=UPI00263101A0|nr:hypothetical protein [uncultured Shewanella sp.]
MNNKLLGALMFSVLLAGCGDDNTKNPDNIKPVEPAPDSTAPKSNDPVWKYVTHGYIGLDGVSESRGKVHVSLGRRFDEVQTWGFACQLGANGLPSTVVVEEHGKKVTKQLYPKDADGTFDIRAAYQLNKPMDELTDEDRNKFFSTDCITRSKKFSIDGNEYYEMLRVRATNPELSASLDRNGHDVFADFNNDGNIVQLDASENGIDNPRPVIGENGDGQVELEIDLDEMNKWLENVGDHLGKGTARPDIYQLNHFSAFDLFRYIDFIRDDLEINITAVPFHSSKHGYSKLKIDNYELSELNTYEFTVNWDVNGDGKFTEVDNSYISSKFDKYNRQLELSHDKSYPAYFESNRWHFKANGDRGIDRGDRQLLTAFNYINIDRFSIREGQDVRFFPEAPTYTERRQWLWRNDIERHINQGGKINVPNEKAYPIDDKGRPYTYVNDFYFFDGDFYDRESATEEDYHQYALDMKVYPSNLRSDMYKPGVITAIDIMLSSNTHMDEKTGEFLLNDIDTPRFELSFWPLMVSGAIVNQFGVERAPIFGIGSGASVGNGLWMNFANKYAMEEFGAMVTDCDHYNIDGEQIFYKGKPLPDVKNTIVLDLKMCFLNNRNNSQGGYFTYDMLSSTHLPYGIEEFELTIYPQGRDAKYPVYDVNDTHDYVFNSGAVTMHKMDSKTYPAVAPDIATVSRLTTPTEDNPSGSAAVLKESHFGWKVADCTLCHNEAKDPKGHGGSSWPVNSASGFDTVQPYFCASCHGSNGAPEAHGAITTCFWCHSANSDGGLPNHGDAGALFLRKQDEFLGNVEFGSKRSPNTWGEQDKYPDTHMPKNSTYLMSKEWPDPWACGTCHIDKQ